MSDGAPLAASVLAKDKSFKDQLLSETEFVVLHSGFFRQSDNSTVKLPVHKTTKANFVFCTLIGHAANMQRFSGWANFL
jgi:hypothetical protein